MTANKARKQAQRRKSYLRRAWIRHNRDPRNKELADRVAYWERQNKKVG